MSTKFLVTASSLQRKKRVNGLKRRCLEEIVCRRERSPQLGKIQNGGAEESRTPDPLGANEVLWPTELQPQARKMYRILVLM